MCYLHVDLSYMHLIVRYRCILCTYPIEFLGCGAAAPNSVYCLGNGGTSLNSGGSGII